MNTAEKVCDAGKYIVSALIASNDQSASNLQHIRQLRPIFEKYAHTEAAQRISGNDSVGSIGEVEAIFCCHLSLNDLRKPAETTADRQRHACR